MSRSLTSSIDHHFVYLRPDELESIRDAVRTGDESRAHPYSALLHRADQALSKSVASVLNKTGIAASGDKQDFYAIGAYSWPKPDTPNGLPYIRRDSIVNPEAYNSEEYDKGHFHSMVEDVNHLSLAYFYTGEEPYAQKAAELLRTWFIDSSTRMNPNLRHAAVQPGVNDGRPSGIIEGVILIEMLDYVALLDGASAWRKEDVGGLKAWFLAFSDWLVGSEFGKREILSENNHGAYYLAQVMAFAAYGGNHRRAESVVGLAKRQIDRQFASDGSMPKEIDRPNSFFYAIYGLRAFVVLARLAERYGQHLWHYGSGNHGIPAIACSFRFLAPYLSGVAEWPGPRPDKGFSPYAIQICRMGGAAYRARVFDEMVRFLASQPSASQAGLTGFLHVSTDAENEALFKEITTVRPVVKRESPTRKLARRLEKFVARLGLLPNFRLQ